MRHPAEFTQKNEIKYNEKVFHISLLLSSTNGQISHSRSIPKAIVYISLKLRVLVPLLLAAASRTNMIAFKCLPCWALSRRPHPATPSLRLKCLHLNSRAGVYLFQFPCAPSLQRREKGRLTPENQWVVRINETII